MRSITGSHNFSPHMTAKIYHAIREPIGSQAIVAKFLGIAERTIQRRENGSLKIDREAELAIHSLHAYHSFGKIFKVLILMASINLPF
jgi:DNA-binding XRE family transcriptional regulator